MLFYCLKNEEEEGCSLLTDRFKGATYGFYIFLASLYDYLILSTSLSGIDSIKSFEKPCFRIS